MEITLDKTSNTQAFIKIKLNEADYQPAVEEKIKEYTRKAQIKGFRPGKVPKSLVQRMYGKSILVEQINDMLSRSLQDYVVKNELNVLGDPLPNVDKDDAINWDIQKDFEFEYELGIAEEFEINLDSKTVLDTYNITMGKDTLAETIKTLQEQMGEATAVDTSEATDSISGTLVNTEGGIDREVSIELTELKESALKQFIGRKSDEVIKFNLLDAAKDAIYASNVAGVSEESLASMPAEFEFTVKKVNRMMPAEINQELFDKVFGKGTVEDQNGFEQKIIDTITDNYRRESESYLKYTLKKKVLDTINFALPDQFLKNWLFRINEGKFTPEAIDKEFEDYKRDLKWTIIKNKAIKVNSLKIETAEIIEAAENVIREQLRSSGLPISMFEDKLDDFADRYLKDEKGENYMKLYNQLMDERVISFFREKLTVNAKDITVEEFRKLELN